MSNKTLPSKRCIVKRSGAGGTDLAAGYSKPIFLSMDEHVSNFWAAGASFDSGTIKVQACPVPDAPQSSPLWQDVVMYPDVGGGRALSLSANGLVTFGDAQLSNCYVRFAWSGVGTNGDFEAHLT
jgi:hypothetical protein